jgi:hypothetical protein
VQHRLGDEAQSCGERLKTSLNSMWSSAALISSGVGAGSCTLSMVSDMTDMPVSLDHRFKG